MAARSAFSRLAPAVANARQTRLLNACRVLKRGYASESQHQVRFRRISSRILVFDHTLQMTVRDALNSAMEEEMVRDETVFIMGEEVARYNGAYKVKETQVHLCTTVYFFSRLRKVFLTSLEKNELLILQLPRWALAVWQLVQLLQVCDPCVFTLIVHHFVSNMLQSSMQMRVHDFQFRDASHRSNCQLGWKDSLHVRRKRTLSGCVPRSQWCCSWCGRTTFARLCCLVWLSSRSESRQPMECGRLQRLAQSMPTSSSLLNDLTTSWKSAIRDPNPVVFLENEMLYGISFPVSTEVLSDDFLLPIGKCKVEREGDDVTIVAHSKMVAHSLEAADELAKEGIKAEVINLRSIRPLDIHTIIKSVKKTNRYVLSICD
jgi:hypothetical protein